MGEGTILRWAELSNSEKTVSKSSESSILMKSSFLWVSSNQHVTSYLQVSFLKWKKLKKKIDLKNENENRLSPFMAHFNCLAFFRLKILIKVENFFIKLFLA